MSTWAPLLLADRSANLRLLVLRELLQLPEDDPEIGELEHLRMDDPIVQNLLALAERDGSFRLSAGGGDSWSGIHSTSQALTRLGYLGFGPDNSTVQRAAEYLFSLQEFGRLVAYPEGQRRA